MFSSVLPSHDASSVGGSTFAVDSIAFSLTKVLAAVIVTGLAMLNAGLREASPDVARVVSDAVIKSVNFVASIAFDASFQVMVYGQRSQIEASLNQIPPSVHELRASKPLQAENSFTATSLLKELT